MYGGDTWSTIVMATAPHAGTDRIGTPVLKRNSEVIHKSLQDMWIAHVDYCLQTLEVRPLVDLARRAGLLKTDVDSCAPKAAF